MKVLHSSKTPSIYGFTLWPLTLKVPLFGSWSSITLEGSTCVITNGFNHLDFNFLGNSFKRELNNKKFCPKLNSCFTICLSYHLLVRFVTSQPGGQHVTTVVCSWMSLSFPRHLFNSITPPQYIYHRYIFISQHFILWSTIPTGCTSKDKFFLSSTGGASNTCNRSYMFFLTWRHKKHHEYVLSLTVTPTDKLSVQSSQESWMDRCIEDSAYLIFGTEWLFSKKLPWETPCHQLQILILFSECLHNFFIDLELSLVYLGLYKSSLKWPQLFPHHQAFVHQLHPNISMSCTFFHIRLRKEPYQCWFDSYYCRQIPPMKSGPPNCPWTLKHVSRTCLSKSGWSFQIDLQFEGEKWY